MSAIIEFQNLLIKEGYNLGKSGADGIVGKLTKSAAYKYAKLKSKQNGHTWFTENLVEVRMSNVFTDKFTDVCIIINNDYCVEVIPWTTKPGKYYVNNPLTVGGIKGTGCVMEGQTLYSHKYFSKSKLSWGGSLFGHFKQIADLNIYRDGNMDNKLDANITTVAPSWFGFFIHSMGKGFSIWNWSAGCRSSTCPSP